MMVFEAEIHDEVLDFLKEKIIKPQSFKEVNSILYSICGIVDFFCSQNEFIEFTNEIEGGSGETFKVSDRSTEYGDFQTNISLASDCTHNLSNINVNPKIVIEPTCGKGNFIIASLENFHSLEQIIGVEIYKPYIWQTKFNILHFFLRNEQKNVPDITIYHCSFFDFNFKKISSNFSQKEVLIIGNPPWVTNSKLGTLNSLNLPKKTNFKNHSGLDAITGKGNFDIAEFITTELLKTFQFFNGYLCLLVKNSVIKNIIYEQRKSNYNFGVIRRHGIDSKKEFNVSVEASFLLGKLNTNAEYICEEYNFYDRDKKIKDFGWVGDKFVSNTSTYIDIKNIDSTCQFTWRQGLKHDCSSIMELDKIDSKFSNALGETVELEEALVYGLLKSSDLKKDVINTTRKFTIVTQSKVGQDTSYIKHEYPKTYMYLKNHIHDFQKRKSSIYNNKPLFSIFGIGDYSFKPYKVAISGLYKTFHFSLILPKDNKPVMLDDTCYLLGFDKLEHALYTLLLLNSEAAVKFFQSITFSDAKRLFTKDVLMRIDLYQVFLKLNVQKLNEDVKEIAKIHEFQINLNLWEEYLTLIKPVTKNQIAMFD